MSHSILEKLSKRKTFAKRKPVKINLQPGTGQISVQTNIIDKTHTNYNVEQLKRRIREKRLVAPKLTKKIIQKEVENKIEGETKQPPAPVKIKKKIKLPGKIQKSKIKKKKKIIDEVILDVPATLIEIDERPIQERMPDPRQTINIKAPAYYLNNREYFVNFINSTFRKYGAILNDPEEKDITCESVSQSKKGDFSLMTHQMIVRDYINLYTPYRGLLLFHGLGAGKTCASIGIAEGIKNTNQVIIMTPASLRMNYVSELKHCGDPIYKINQFWEKIQTAGNPHIEKALSEVLNIPIPYIRKKGFAWMIDVTKPSNFKNLQPEDQKSIDSQINEMIMKKYKFINYNGMRDSHLNKMIEESKALQNSENPFDNKVVIIDEAHNFVSRIVNKIKSKKTSLSTRLYELILNASNCRLVFLTGTPIINYPNEIGVLFNMLRGYIKTYYIKINTAETGATINQRYMVELFKNEKLLDYIEYSASKTTLIITRNPFGFVNRKKKSKGNIVYGGISKSDKGIKTDAQFIKYIISTLKKNNIAVFDKQIQVENHKALPDTLETFKDLFIDNVTGEIKQENVFKRRIIGLTSYFRSAQESLLPRYNETPEYKHIIKIPMSNFQVGVYEKARAAERKEEDRNRRKRAKQQEGIYAETKSSYRIFSRAFCNFVFPYELDEETNTMLARPMPQEGMSLEQAISNKKQKSDIGETKKRGESTEIDEDILDATTVQDKLDNQDGLYTLNDVAELEEKINQQTDQSYKQRIDNALKLLKKNGDKYLSVQGLQKYGPKLLRVLQNIKNPPTSTDEPEGLHLVYSQFRTIEGIGILSLILEQNGFARFKISRKTGTWKLDLDDNELGKPKYALYTGTETAEEREIIRNIFNSSWDKIPSTLATQLRQINTSNNLGEIIKVLMITSSGSEGITLKNTRYVHLLEPYWHPVRTDQVIGRARRICSHKDLPENLRTVEVFVYLMTFTDIQINGDKEAKTKEERLPILSRALINSNSDKSKIDRTSILTSDETLFEISNIKKNTNNSLLNAIKETSIDCNLHQKSNKREGIMCYTFGSPSSDVFSYKPDYSTEEKDSVQAQNIKKITWRGKIIKIQGVKYVIKNTDETNPKIGEIYDLNSYKQAKKGQTNPILVGRTRVNPKNPKKIQLLEVGDPNF